MKKLTVALLLIVGVAITSVGSIGLYTLINQDETTNNDDVNNDAVGVITFPTTRSFYQINQSVRVQATVQPANATNKAVNWTSSNPSKVSVTPDASDSQIATLKCLASFTGNVTITATTAQGGFSATCVCSFSFIPSSIWLEGDPDRSNNTSYADEGYYEFDTQNYEFEVFMSPSETNTAVDVQITSLNASFISTYGNNISQFVYASYDPNDNLIRMAVLGAPNLPGETNIFTMHIEASNYPSIFIEFNFDIYQSVNGLSIDTTEITFEG